MEYFLIGMALLVAGPTLYGTYKFRLPIRPANKLEAPTVSLLIPARNETHAVARSLTSALALDYPKLEIIVLDDQSQDNTSEKIRSFAQDGIRFVKGQPLPEGWVGKNWACHQLSEAASGEYLVFCDMDVHLSSKALTQLIRYMETERLDGCSVMPRLALRHRLGAIATPLLAWLVLLLAIVPTRLRPAYGGLMLFKANAYSQHGGYERYRDAMLPELMIAADLARFDKFRFFINAEKLGIALYKKTSSLNDSRLRYLSKIYDGHPVLGWLHALLLLLPPATLLFTPLVYVALAVTFALAMKPIHQNWLIATLLLPIACLWELSLLIRAGLRQRLGLITWKNRRV